MTGVGKGGRVGGLRTLKRLPPPLSLPDSATDPPPIARDGPQPTPTGATPTPPARRSPSPVRPARVGLRGGRGVRLVVRAGEAVDGRHRLERQPGQKEARFAHLLSGEVTIVASAAPAPESPVVRDDPDRLDALENTIELLRSEVADLREEVGELKRLLQ